MGSSGEGNEKSEGGEERARQMPPDLRVNMSA